MSTPKRDPLKCSGVRTSGHWKGWQCGSTALYEYEGKMYCGAHYAMAVKGKDFNEIKKPAYRTQGSHAANE